MQKFVTDNPQGNFETMLNFVYSKDGQAYVRADEDGEGVLLVEYARRMCIEHGCDELKDVNDVEVDELICDCALDYWSCPVFVMYMCACQAVHLRDRLRLHEEKSVHHPKFGTVRVAAPDEASTLVSAAKLGGVNETKLEFYTVGSVSKA